ncbi:MAG TPA: hypothetical protein VEV63_06095 [Streptosporangiaceae bacterium]|nr:hypothetical protein [Streptosporangiaceae bacterium]
MSTGVLVGKQVHAEPAATIRPYLLGGLAALSVGAAAIHFAVVFEHFAEYALYGVFFLVISWAQMIWPAVLLWRPSRPWMWLGIAGNAIVIAVYVASRTVGLPFGPDLHHTESVGALDVVSCLLEFALIVGCAALLSRPSLADRPVGRRGAVARAAAVIAIPAAVIAATTAVMTPGWAGPEGPAGMASGTSSSMSRSSSSPAIPGMGDMGTTDGRPDMRMYGSTAPPTSGQVLAAAQLIKETDVSLRRYANVQAAFAAGYTYVLKTNGEEHLLYNGPNPSYQGLNPQHPSSLVYAIDVPHHAPILLGAMYIMGRDQQNGPQIGGGLTRWHSHLVTCVSGRETIAGFGIKLRDSCNPATWQDRYTAQMLHVWVVPYTGGVFSDDLSRAATNAAVRAVLAERG